MHLLLGNNANDRKMVVAFRAVDVMDMVRAPKDFVMAAEHDDPKNPVVENSTKVIIFARTDQVGTKSSSISFIVPGRVR